MEKIKYKGKEYADCIHVSGKGNFGLKARISILFSLSFTASTEIYCENLPGWTNATPVKVSSYDITDWFKNLFRDKRGLMAPSEMPMPPEIKYCTRCGNQINPDTGKGRNVSYGATDAILLPCQLCSGLTSKKEAYTP